MTTKQKDYFIKRIKALAQDAIDRKQGEGFLTPKREEEYAKKLIPVEQKKLMEIVKEKMYDSITFSRNSYKGSTFSLDREQCFYNFEELRLQADKDSDLFYAKKNDWIREIRKECDALCDGVMFSPDAESLFEKIKVFESKLSIVG